VRDAIARQPRSDSRLERFDGCGRYAWVLVATDQPTRYTISASLCHDRFCVPCAAARGRQIAAALAERSRGRRILFVTLTLRSTPGDLAGQLKRLYASFTKLRRVPLWRTTIRGGAAVCEVTYNASRQAWHPHLHVIAEGSWLPQSDLKSHWHRITGDSYVVDIRLAKTTDTLAGYVAKYLTKPIAASYANRPDQLTEAVAAFKGRRLALTFGTWRGAPLTLDIDDTDWRPVAPLAEILAAAADPLSYANQILKALKGNPTCHQPQSTRASPDAETIPCRS